MKYVIFYYKNTEYKMNILELKDVSLTYFSPRGETLALKDIDMQIEEGQFISLVGPSGCGKTTILSIISGLMPATHGEIYIDGVLQNKHKQKKKFFERIKTLNKKNVDEQKYYIGYMFQKDHLFEWLTIKKNIYLGLNIMHKKTKENMAFADNLLKKYGLWDFRNKYPNELSGGMRQRVALIRTLALNPKILLLDEPFSALDFQTRLNVCDDVYDIIKKEGKTAILVTHDISEAISMSDKIYVLSSRPATIKKIYNLDLNKTVSPLKRREDDKFVIYFDKIWRDLV